MPKLFHFEEISFSTREKFELVDLTREVEEVVRRAGIRNGIVVLQLPHATASLMMNENESGLKEDILRQVGKLIPERAAYQHDRIDDNAHAHIKSAVIGTSIVLPLVNGKLVRGTWQNIFAMEQDGPRGNRRLVVLVLGE
jgi:secondary thiamine-phosphate synthase enzyme